MSADKKNLAASVRARLLNVARRRGSEFQLVLVEFAIERFLFRLGRSRHADTLILKGAMLFKVWSGNPHRATWDLDLMGQGKHAIGDVVTAVRDICSLESDDAIVFDMESIRGEEIRAAVGAAGVRVKLRAALGGARIPMQVDVGFGDDVTINPNRERYPTLLDHPPPEILVYPREAVIAEKVEAMASMGLTNSRMKDYYDVNVLAASHKFDGVALSNAIRSTFRQRGTPVPSANPLFLDEAFLRDPRRGSQWRAFLHRSRLEGPEEMGPLLAELRPFIVPVLNAVRDGREYEASWKPGGPWRTRSKVG